MHKYAIRNVSLSFHFMFFISSWSGETFTEKSLYFLLITSVLKKKKLVKTRSFVFQQLTKELLANSLIILKDHKQSQNHSGCKGPWQVSRLTPRQKQGQLWDQIWLLGASSTQGMKTSKDDDDTTSGQPTPLPYCSPGETVSPYAQPEAIIIYASSRHLVPLQWSIPPPRLSLIDARRLLATAEATPSLGWPSPALPVFPHGESVLADCLGDLPLDHIFSVDQKTFSCWSCILLSL